MGRLFNVLVFQVLRYCGKEGTKNPHRREDECGNSGMRKCVCSNPLHIAELASQAVSPMEPGRVWECFFNVGMWEFVDFIILCSIMF